MARDYTAPRIWMDLIRKHIKPGEAFTAATLASRAQADHWEAESFLRCHPPVVAISRMVEAGELVKTDGLYTYRPESTLTLEQRVEILEATVRNLLRA